MYIAVFEGDKRPPNLQRAINRQHFQHFEAALTRTMEAVDSLPHFERIERLYRLDRRAPQCQVPKAA
jgi:hypothetical protein